MNDSLVHWMFGAFGSSIIGLIIFVAKMQISRIERLSDRVQQLEVSEARADQSREDILSRLERIEGKINNYARGSQ